MLLTLDIGNSAVKGGLFEGPELVRIFSVSRDAVDTGSRPRPPAWREALSSPLSDASINQIGLASAVPDTATAVIEALSDLADASVTHVSPTSSLPFELGYETPNTLGADRLAAAAAGWVHFGRVESPPRSVIVVDAGTAVTCEVVHREGIYRGGTIGAGPGLVRRALRSGTAQLPTVPLNLPEDPVGHSTQTALQSGITWGLVDGVRGMIDRLGATLPDDPKTVLTGGWGSLLADHLDRPVHHAPTLTLHGVRLFVSGTE
jgi:type III pantothenate kinase